METIVRFFNDLSFHLMLLMDSFGGMLFYVFQEWPYEKAPDFFIITAVSGTMFLIIGFVVPFMVRTDKYAVFEKEPPTEQGEIIIDPNAFVIRVLHWYFGKYPKSSCHIIRYAIGISFGAVAIFHGAINLSAALSSFLYLHGLQWIYHAPSLIAGWFLGTISWGVEITISIVSTLVSAIVAVVYFLIAPAVLFTILFLIFLILLCKSGFRNPLW